MKKPPELTPDEQTEHDYWMERLKQDFGADILLKAQRIVKGWGKLSAKQQHVFLTEKRENES